MKPLHRAVIPGPLLQTRHKTPTGSACGEPRQRHGPPEPALRYLLVVFGHRIAPTELDS